MPAERRVAIVVFPDVQSLDIAGPLEVFTGASQLLESDARPEPRYRVEIVAAGGGPVTTSSGLDLLPHADLTTIRGPLDTLLVAGGNGVEAALSDGATVAHVQRLAKRARRVASVCTGAFVLAEGGLLDGRRAATHWASCARLQRRYPAVRVEADPIFVRDGNVATSAGVTAGMDLALALVEEDLGREVALTVARWLVLFMRRPGNQAQFSTPLATQLADRDALREVQRSIVDRPGDDHAVEALAARAHMSPRHFARAFTADVGETPARYVARVRLEAARRRLEESAVPVGTLAAELGYGSAETMRRAFVLALGIPPGEYRSRFQPAHTTTPA